MTDKNNTMVIFTNKKTKEGQPDYRGNGVINDVEMSVSIWKNISKSGNEYLKAVFSPAEKKVEEKCNQPQLNDEIPF